MSNEKTSLVNKVLMRLGKADKIETKDFYLKDGNKIALSGDSVGDIALNLENGEYELADGRIIVIEDSAITEVKEAKEEEVEASEDVKEEVKEEEKKEETVEMSVVEKIIELTEQKGEKSELTKEDIQEIVAAELSKAPVVAPMKAPKKEEIVKLSKHDIKLMSVPERVNSFMINDIRSRGHKVDLATTTSVTTTYAGEFALPYIGAALLSGETLANNNITIKQNVGLAGVTVKNLGTIGAMADATCDFTDTGSVTLTERKLTPKDLQVHVELCKQDFLDDWEAEKMGAGRLGKSLPPNFQSFLLQRLAAEVAANVESYVWKGTDVATQFEGIEAKLTTTTDLTGGAVTTSNVLTKIRIVTAAIPDALQLKPTVKLYCATDIVRAYKQKQGDNGIYDQYQTAASIPMMVDGYEMIWCPGMTAGSIIAAESSNLYFGTDLVSDHSQAKVLDMENLDGSDNVRVIMRFTAGTQVGVVADCVHGVQAA